MDKGKLLLTGTALVDGLSVEVTVSTTSATIAALIAAAGATIPPGAAAVTLVVGDNDIHYNPVGAAAATNAKLPQPAYSFPADADALGTACLYAASDLAVGVIIHKVG